MPPTIAPIVSASLPKLAAYVIAFLGDPLERYKIANVAGRVSLESHNTGLREDS